MPHKLTYKFTKSEQRLAHNTIVGVIKRAGSQTSLAKKLGVTQPLVSRWVAGDLVGPVQVVKLAKFYKIKKAHLRPDIF